MLENDLADSDYILSNKSLPCVMLKIIAEYILQDSASMVCSVLNKSLDMLPGLSSNSAPLSASLFTLAMLQYHSVLLILIVSAKNIINNT